MEHVALLYGWVMGYIYIASKCMYAKLLQPCLTLCHSMDHSLPGSSVHGILHARVLEWVAMSSYRGSSWPRSRTMSLVSCIGRWVLYHQCHLGSPASKYLSTNYLLTVKGRILIVTLVWKISNRYCLIQATKLTSKAGQVKTTRVLDDALRNHVSIMWATTTPRTNNWIESRGNISRPESRRVFRVCLSRSCKAGRAWGLFRIKGRSKDAMATYMWSWTGCWARKESDCLRYYGGNWSSLHRGCGLDTSGSSMLNIHIIALWPWNRMSLFLGKNKLK